MVLGGVEVPEPPGEEAEDVDADAGTDADALLEECGGQDERLVLLAFG